MCQQKIIHEVTLYVSKHCAAKREQFGRGSGAVNRSGMRRSKYMIYMCTRAQSLMSPDEQCNLGKIFSSSDLMLTSSAVSDPSSEGPSVGRLFRNERLPPQLVRLR